MTILQIVGIICATVFAIAALPFVFTLLMLLLTAAGGVTILALVWVEDKWTSWRRK